MAITKVSRGLLSTGIVDNSNATAITIDSSENTAFSGSVSISHNSGDSLTLTKTTTEPSLRIEGDTDKDFVLTVSGEKLTITQNDGATDIALFDHDTKATTFKGNVESPRFILNGTDSATTRYIFTDNTNTGDGRLIIQSGGGSSGYGGAINLYSHAHASKPGDVVAGISSGSGGAFRVNTSGVDGGSDVIRVDSDGLKFGSDTAAANALHDYEEGDHTATISAASGSISLYSNYNNIAYTKVGRKVHVQGKLAVQSVSSPTGATTISLPFAVADQTDRGEDATHVGIGYFNGASIDTGFHTIYMEVIQGVSYVRPYVMKPSSTAGNAPGTHNLGDGYLAQGSDIYLNFTYYAA